MFWRRCAGTVVLAGFLCGQAAAASTAGRVEINDTFAAKEWHLDAIHAQEGWAITTGTRDVVVAVIDSGVDITHPDLKENIWTNPDEIAGNKKDDDHDGFVDDVHGWNFVTDSPDVRPIGGPDADPQAWIHGTAVASLIAARGNNDLGIAGVAWRARIMPLVALDADGTGRDDAIIRSIAFAVAHGADIINLSLVGYDYDEGLDRAIREAASQGVLVVSAAGNSDDRAAGEDMDKLPGFPACDKGVDGRGSLTVTAIDRNDRKADYANYGTCVDVSAPGADLFAARPETDPDGSGPTAGYIGKLNGTSAAAPLVTGLAVLLKTEHPFWTGTEIAKRITETADPVDAQNPAYAGKMGSGRINVARALAQDDATRSYGPLFLEGADVGQPPYVRVFTEDGTMLAMFPVADLGDRRGVRAAFIRWTDAQAGQPAVPDIAVSMIGDPTGAWRIFRMDGLLTAAGVLGSGIRGGVTLAAQDIVSTGADMLFLGEALGSRAWYESRTGAEEMFIPFLGSSSEGVSALSVSRPVPSFFITSRTGDHQVTVVGEHGIRLAEGQIAASSTNEVWTNRRAMREGGGTVYDVSSSAGHVAFVNDASGLHATDESITVHHWVQVPQGDVVHPGWRYYETWPRY